jgi:hypothetical protein
MSGQIFFDPDRDWIIPEYEVTDEAAGISKSVRAVRQFTPTADGTPLITSIEKKHKDVIVRANRHVESVTTIKITYEKKAMQDEEFALTAFGLPEPLDVSPADSRWYTRWYVIGAAGGIACLFLDMVFARLARRAA